MYKKKKKKKHTKKKLLPMKIIFNTCQVESSTSLSMVDFNFKTSIK